MRLIGDKRAFTRLEVTLLTGMLFAMIINGIATLGGGLDSGNRPMGTPVPDEGKAAAEVHAVARPANAP
jgi:Flp pilus assembly pilin Flp